MTTTGIDDDMNVFALPAMYFVYFLENKYMNCMKDGESIDKKRNEESRDEERNKEEALDSKSKDKESDSSIVVIIICMFQIKYIFSRSSY